MSSKEYYYLKSFFRELIGVNEFKDLTLSNIEEIRELHNQELKAIMATFQEILSAIQTNGQLIISSLDALTSESAEIKKALQDAANNVATPEQLESALANINSNNEQLNKIKETVVQLVPTLPSPSEPTPVPTEPTEPIDALPTPEPVPTPSEPGEIDVIPSEPEVGLPGSVEIDVI